MSEETEDEREAKRRRLDDALRENLRRRKAQARARARREAIATKKPAAEKP